VIRVATNAQELARAIRGFGGNVTRIQLRTMQRWGTSVAKKLKTIAGRHVEHGIQGRTTLRGREPFTTLISRSNIGWWREFGTGIYGPLRRRIRSKGGPYVNPKTGKLQNRRALRWEVGGGYRFARSVRGMRAHPWFVPTVKMEIPRLLRESVADFQKALTKLKDIRARQQR
jgi:hypothetical protein